MPAITLTSAERDAIQAQADDVVGEVRDDEGCEVRLVVAGRTIRAGNQLSDFLMSMIGQLADGSNIGVISLPQELTTTTAAQELGISRPTLMKLVRAGRIPSHRVGTHTRIKRDDLFAYRDQRRNERRTALKELRDLELSSGLVD